MSDVKLSVDIFNSPIIKHLSHSIRILTLTECTSTQILLLNWWEEQTEDIDFTPVLHTEVQLQGIGQKNRSWISGSGSLTFSVLISPNEKISWTPLEMAIICKNYFKEMHQIDFFLKWPNDLVDSNGKKIGGIICHGRKNKVVVGFGLNLYKSDNNFLADYSAATIFNHQNIDKNLIRDDFNNYIYSNRYHHLNTKLKTDWLNSCIHLNKNVSINDNDKCVTGIFKDLGEFGQAIIEDESNFKHQIANGSIIIN